MATWPEVVATVGKWYEKNIHTYQFALGWTNGPGRIKKTVQFYTYPGGESCGRKWPSGIILAGDDCSGFVSCCLQVFGTHSKGYYVSNTGGDKRNGAAYKGQTEYHNYIKKGFIAIDYDKSKLQPYDIMVGPKHTEIYAGNGKSWAWGNVHDGRTYENHGTNSGMPCVMSNSGYTLIYRYAALGGNVNIDIANIDVPASNNANNFTSADYDTALQYLQAGLNSNQKKYYVNENYEVWKDQYPNLFSESNPNINNLTISTNVNNQLIGDASTYYNQKKVSGRIYSTNDAKIILDELTLPISNKDDNYVSSDVKNSHRSSLQSKYDKMSISDYENANRTTTTNKENNNKNNTSTNA